MDLLIFGAQGYALGAYQAIKALYPKRSIPCFVVSQMGSNANILGEIPVREINELSSSMSESEKRNISILIATPENIHPEIVETIERYGFYNHIRLTSERWGELMKLYHSKVGSFLPLSALPVGCTESFVRVYMAKSHVDRPLQRTITLPDYVLYIQVGREKTETAIADIVDNTGDNISDRNGNYSELTGLYWIWKNKLLLSDEFENGECDGNGRECERQYYGFCQYRRMLALTDDDLLRLIDNDVDVVLPYPLPYEPSIHAHHERYLKQTDWNALLEAIKELQPGYADALPAILNQQYLYNYNVILAKKDVLRDYCEWLFPILERTEELSVPKGSERADRYIGYMAETLETLYFMKNKDKMNIVHTGCKMFV